MNYFEENKFDCKCLIMMILRGVWGIWLFLESGIYVVFVYYIIFFQFTIDFDIGEFATS
jgi:hypothetical protein